ncbi:hypothetical protein F5Y15DRAFT_388740 [Xylariaceae sp. FL0016]|nr:hypothetical protein F5Y15DRAFT_388740 [Xylariaceae sp. FL0016]
MGGEQPTGCLNSEPHDANITDPLRHYLGCLDYEQRSNFFNDDANPLWKDEIKHLETQGKSSVQAFEIGDTKRRKWKQNCKNELSRIEFLREKLVHDPYDRHLTQMIVDSGARWRRSNEYKENIDDVRLWRQKQNNKKSSSVRVETQDERSTRKHQAWKNEAYDPEKDININLIQFKASSPGDFTDENGQKNPNIMGAFPDQKIKINKIIPRDSDDSENGDSILHKNRFPRATSYFHIPSNNMKWAEEAIARYFGQSTPDFDAIKSEVKKEQRTETALILKESHWRGQLHGESIEASSRFMRPFCEAISSSPNKIDHMPQNIVLFMPYLHWETSRQRERFARLINEISWRKTTELQDAEDRAKKHRQRKRMELRRRTFKPTLQDEQDARTAKKLADIVATLQSKYNTTWKAFSDKTAATDSRSVERLVVPPGHELKKHSKSKMDWTGRKGRILTLATAVQRLRKFKDQLSVDGNGRVEAKSELGQYLIDAARLYEGMSNYRDKKLLENFLCNDPPLHPRRTLDQAYYWTLNTTRSRDRDQVVYRATTVPEGVFHSFDSKTGKWEGHDDKANAEPKAEPNTRRDTLYDSHTCFECTANIRKVSRVIMVDQLWMWILDAKTIITCFPKRYGVNKEDSSGIHKRIRTRIALGRYNQVKSVFDLALIILDECSNTFFDRTRTSGNQPQVLEAFSEAIANITHKQTIAFERLWRWTDHARSVYRSPSAQGDTSRLHVPLLDINPEGELEREIKDIVEELGIMIHINRTHRDVLKQFVSHVEHILDPDGQMGERYSRPKTSRNFIYRGGNIEKRPATPGFQAGDEVTADIIDTYNWFKTNADELTCKVNDRTEQLEELRRKAEETATHVKDLLQLKQQQASVVQAWQSVKQADEAIRQGRSIMMFTVVTIVFLPLSFMTSIFGMNVYELDSDKLSLIQVFKFIFPVSLGIIILALVFSLSTWLRAVSWACYTRIVTPVVVWSGLYRVYLGLGWPTSRLYDSTQAATDKLKEPVARKHLKKIREANQKKRGEEERRKQEEAKARDDMKIGEVRRPLARAVHRESQANADPGPGTMNVTDAGGARDVRKTGMLRFLGFGNDTKPSDVELGRSERRSQHFGKEYSHS